MQPRTAFDLKNIKNLKNILHKVMLVVCICVFAFSLFMVAKKLYAYHHDDAQYQKIREQVVASGDAGENFARIFATPLPAESQPEPDAAPSLPYVIGHGDTDGLDENGILTDYSALRSQNKELAGWIQMSGFAKPLDYPVMQAKDNDYYLTHDFYGNESQAGSIFMDSRNKPLEVDRHIILYGHAMKDMSMFGNLKEFPARASEHTKNTRIYLDLLNTRLEYEVFATYYEDASYNYRQTSFSSDEEFSGFVEKIRSKSVYDYKIKLTGSDKLLTLSTCNNNLGGDIRSVTHARLVRQILYDGTDADQPEAADPEHSSKAVVSANVYLKELSLEYGDTAKPEKAVLSPAFMSGIKEFSAQLPPEAEAARLILETADPEASAEVALNGQKADTASLRLEYGENILLIKIISRDKKYSRTCTVTITRTPAAFPTASPSAVSSGTSTGISSPAVTPTVSSAPSPDETTP